jgi:hypothetical protein
LARRVTTASEAQAARPREGFVKSTAGMVGDDTDVGDVIISDGAGILSRG